MSGFLDKDEIIGSLTKEDVTKIVMSLGSAAPKVDSQGNLIFQTICHNAEGGSYKLYYYHEPSGQYRGRTFTCYTGCGESFSIIELVIRANRAKGKTVTFYQALRYIAVTAGKIRYKDEAPVTNTLSDWTWINRLKRTGKQEQETDVELPIVPETVLSLFPKYPHEAWLKDGIAPEVMEEFEVGYSPTDNAITIPHRDIYGNLVGIRERFLDEADIQRRGKYNPIIIEGKPLRHPLGHTFYGIYQNADAIMRNRKAIVYEGEKSVLLNHTYFPNNDFSLATCGSSISSTQIKILLEQLKVDEVILAYDKEYTDAESFRAKAYFEKLKTKVAALVPFCRVSIIFDTHGYLEEKDSPCDRGIETLLKLLDEKKIINLDEIRKG